MRTRVLPRFAASLVLLGAACLALTGCASRVNSPKALSHLQAFLGTWIRSYSVSDGDHSAHVTETWEFKGDGSASTRGVWNGFVTPGETVEGVVGIGQYSAVIEQRWRWQYLGTGRFRLTEHERRIAGPKYMTPGDSYTLVTAGHELEVEDGDEDAPLHRLSSAPAPVPQPPQTHPPRSKKSPRH
ncbi:MAG: hypothetical protein QOE70_6868 [Chthoniobacter sp.]|jgi:hypothetical protein|nr:hypothetical protein [Chthoniobacter sp.]